MGQQILRGRAVAARGVHIPKVDGSIPSLATKKVARTHENKNRWRDRLASKRQVRVVAESEPILFWFNIYITMERIYTNSKGITTKIFAETVEDEAYEQIVKLANHPIYSESTIRIMPDTHAGKSCTIGTTITLNGVVTPNLVGVDIGCGMLAVELDCKDIDFAKLDSVIRSNIPSGKNIHAIIQAVPPISLKQLRCYEAIDHQRALLSIGTLGGGNHFIEVDRSLKTGKHWLVIHTGSRKLGVDVCKHYQDKAIKNTYDTSKEISDIVSRLKREGREREIQQTIKAIPKSNCDKELAYLTGEDFEDYIHDMEIVQRYASRNRYVICKAIIFGMGWFISDNFETIHNYIDVPNMILRKGAVSAQDGEKLIIPMNMRDGSLICIGKGNKDWNYSAPHGAGRIMSRAKAKELLSMDKYMDSMKGIFTTSVNSYTIDESPMAYKPMDEIIRTIEPTADIVDTIKPVYNFKATE